MKNKPKNNQLLSIQYLRAFAALAIVFHHAREQFPGFEATFPTDIGSAGVDVFFVISGFIMVLITDLGDRNVPKFIWNRIIRIVPLYWFYSMIAILLYTVAPGLFRGNGLTFQHVILSLFFIPHPNPGDLSSLSPLIKVGWTLNYEMFFYLVFAIAMMANYARRVLITFLVFAILVAVNASQLITLPAELKFYCDDIVLEFSAGMLLCHVYKMGKLQPAILAKISLLALGIYILIVNLSPEILTIRSIKFGIPAVLIVAGLLSIEKYLTELKLPLLLGNASYSIYLSHIMAIALLRYIYPRLGLITEGLVSTTFFVLVALMLGSLFGIVSHLSIEKPLLNLCRKI
jgi:exopolysaccharide production protein ExoZ